MIAAMGDKTLRNSIDMCIQAGRDICINITMYLHTSKLKYQERCSLPVQPLDAAT